MAQALKILQQKAIRPKFFNVLTRQIIFASFFYFIINMFYFLKASMKRILFLSFALFISANAQADTWNMLKSAGASLQNSAAQLQAHTKQFYASTAGRRCTTALQLVGGCCILAKALPHLEIARHMAFDSRVFLQIAPGERYILTPIERICSAGKALAFSIPMTSLGLYLIKNGITNSIK